MGYLAFQSFGVPWLPHPPATVCSLSPKAAPLVTISSDPVFLATKHPNATNRKCGPKYTSTLAWDVHESVLGVFLIRRSDYLSVSLTSPFDIADNRRSQSGSTSDDISSEAPYYRDTYKKDPIFLKHSRRVLIRISSKPASCQPCLLPPEPNRQARRLPSSTACIPSN